jgi:hypothetical protein
VRLRKSYKDGVNSLPAAERGRTRLPDGVTTQAPGLTWLAARPTAAAHRSAPLNASVYAGADGCWVGLLGQLLDHQEAAQVTLARAAWPLRLGWKKSRALTWLAVNW